MPSYVLSVMSYQATNIDMKALLSLAEELTPDTTAAIESYEPEASVQWLKDNGFIS